LRFAEAGERVVVLERGAWVTRENFVGDLGFFWLPHRNRFGMNDLRSRGKTITPWLGAGVGGGSHVYAGTLKRCDDWTGFPAAIAGDDMSRWYDVAEAIMQPSPYPDWPPYADNRATKLLYEAATTLREDAAHADPGDPVVDAGAVKLAISFAPPGGAPAEDFVNVHGALQRYHHPGEQAIFGGDIDAKNTLDKNYLHLAQARGAEIRAMCEADRIEPLPGGGYRVDYKHWVGEAKLGRRWLRKWFPRRVRTSDTAGSITARRVVLAAGCVGSTELLLRNRDRHRTLPSLPAALGGRYTTNGDFVSLILPFRGIFIGWLAFLAAIWGLFAGIGWVVAAGAATYLATMLFSRAPFDPDLGTTNSDFLRFRGPGGKGVVYVESGRYPTPERLVAAVLLSVLGQYRPHRYRVIVRVSSWLRRWVPPFSLLARTWPIPLLQMGKDRAVGHFELDPAGRAIIQFDIAANRDFYAYLDRVGKRVARAAKAFWLPNVVFRLSGKLEVPHNQGGVPMGESAADGVVDHAGRVFGHDDLMVLDGAIIPVSPGPNPAFTILALAERAMSVVTAQIATGGPIQAKDLARSGNQPGDHSSPGVSPCAPP
jgi:cholesterol oxidase